VGVDAVGAAAVGDHLGLVRDLGQARLELGERHRARALDVPGIELDPRPHVDDDDLARAQALGQLVATDRLDLVAQVVARGALDVAQARGGDLAQREPERDDVPPSRAVVHARALAPGGDQAGPAQHLQVLGGVRHRQPRLLGQLLDGALALGQQVEDRQARPACQRAADARELVEQSPLALVLAHGIDSIIQLID
jgi:hypothetical protein